MKRVGIFFILLGALLIFPANIYAENDVCTDVDEKAIQVHLSLSEFKIINKKPVSGLCEVIIKVDSDNIPLYYSKGFIIAGKMFKDREHLTGKTLEKLQKDNFISNLPLLKKAIAFTYKPQKAVGKVLYMFTDPICPHCSTANSEIMKFADKYGVEINIVLTSMNGEKSTKKCIEALCRGFEFTDYIKKEWKESEDTNNYQCREGKDKYAIAATVSENLNVNSAPMFFSEDGKSISGANIIEIKNALEVYKVVGSNE
jgi:hypothetical protein